jgi:hypothetical protein
MSELDDEGVLAADQDARFWMCVGGHDAPR